LDDVPVVSTVGDIQLLDIRDLVREERALESYEYAPAIRAKPYALSPRLYIALAISYKDRGGASHIQRFLLIVYLDETVETVAITQNQMEMFMAHARSLGIALPSWTPPNKRPFVEDQMARAILRECPPYSTDWILSSAKGIHPNKHAEDDPTLSSNWEVEVQDRHCDWAIDTAIHQALGGR
jgi:hypothetical protein